MKVHRLTTNGYILIAENVHEANMLKHMDEEEFLVHTEFFAGQAATAELIHKAVVPDEHPLGPG